MILKEKLVNLRQTTTTSKWMQEKHSGWSALSVFITEKYWCNQSLHIKTQTVLYWHWIKFYEQFNTSYTIWHSITVSVQKMLRTVQRFKATNCILTILEAERNWTFKAYLLDFFCIRWSIRSPRQMFRRGNVCHRSRDSHLLRKKIYKKPNIYPKWTRLALKKCEFVCRKNSLTVQ